MLRRMVRRNLFTLATRGINTITQKKPGNRIWPDPRASEINKEDLLRTIKTQPTTGQEKSYGMRDNYWMFNKSWRLYKL